jgi:hypothetical protein
VSRSLPLRGKSLPKAEEMTAQWEKQFHDEPTVLRELTHAYRQAERHDDALRTAKRVTAVAPSVESYRALAWVHYERSFRTTGPDAEAKAEAEREACLNAYARALAQPPQPVRSHDVINRDYAQALIEWNRPEEALPFAQAAAENGQPYGLRILADCLSELERWDEAEEAAKAASQHRDYAMTWLHWCVYHGRGEFHAAAYALKEWIDKSPCAMKGSMSGE